MLLIIRRFLLVLFVLTGLFFVLSPFLVPWVVERSANNAFSAAVNGELSIERVSFNPFLLTLETEDVSVKKPDGTQIIQFAALHLDVAWKSLWKGSLEVQKIALQGPDILLELTKEGSLKAAQMLKPAQEKEPASEANKPLVFRIAQIVVTEGRLELLDSNGSQLETGDINLTAKDITTEAGKAFDLSELLVPLADGRLNVKGAVKHSPLEVDVRIVAEGLPAGAMAALALPQGFKVSDGVLSGDLALKYAETLKVGGSIDLKSFALETQGALKFAKLEQLTVPAFSFDAAEKRLHLETGLAVNAFAAEMAIPVKSIAVERVNVETLAYDLPANQLMLGSVQVTSPEVMLEQGQAVNNEVSAQREAAAKAAGGMPQIELPELKLQQGSLHYLDSILPGDSRIDVTGINLLMQHVKIAEAVEGTFDVSALVAEASPLTAKGNFKKADTLDLEGRFVLDKLSHQILSPYTEAYVGRTADAGSLYVDMNYKISEDRLDGINTLLFDRWSWGGAVEAYEGEAVPVDMAFALLQDSRGRVNMKIPVEGNLNDPDIKIEALVRKATTKAVTKLVSSPFKLLGGLIPGGKSDMDLTKVKFDASVAEMVPLEKAKLDALAVALKERPRLKLELTAEAYQAFDLQQPEEEGGGPQLQSEAALKRLAIMRAETVYQLLLEQGVPADRLIQNIPKLDMSDKKRTPYVRLKLIK